jgi:hypothetical protein
MAEVYFAATGPLHWMKQFEQYMEANAFYIPYTLPNGQVASNTLSGLMEPIQLYRFIFPDSPPARNFVLKTLMRGKIGSPGQLGLSLPIFALRKALGLKEIPDIGDVNVGPVMHVPTEHLQIAMIGFKEDPTSVIQPTGVLQERV